MILAVIPARMGSTRIPRKNLCEIEPGLSLVQQAINCAHDCGLIDQVVVSTDDILLPVRGAHVIGRPAELSGPTADIADAVAHAAAMMPGNWTHVVTLQPAVLARSPLIVRSLIQAVIDAQAGGGVTMAHTPPWHWRAIHGRASVPWMGPNHYYPRSQDSPRTWAEVNAVQVATIAAVICHQRWRLPLVIAELPAWTVSLDIDVPMDLDIARGLWPWAKLQLQTWQCPIHTIESLQCAP